MNEKISDHEKSLNTTTTGTQSGQNRWADLVSLPLNTVKPFEDSIYELTLSPKQINIGKLPPVPRSSVPTEEENSPSSIITHEYAAHLMSFTYIQLLC